MGWQTYIKKAEKRNKQVLKRFANANLPLRDKRN